MKNKIDKTLIKERIKKETGDDVKVKFALLGGKGELIVIIKANNYHWVFEGQEISSQSEAYDIAVDAYKKRFELDESK